MTYRIKSITVRAKNYNKKKILDFKGKCMHSSLNNIVTTIINQWDPLEIGFGFEDEYDSEVNLVMELLEFTDDASILAEGINVIFFISGSSSCEEYNPSIFKKSFFDCYMIALYIQDAILQLKS